uniref:HMG domain-containing protein n=2 Tax=Clytia hemisphaerica TaxID=252671 RepID=A0A7M5UHH5_9CNID
MLGVFALCLRKEQKWRDVRDEKDRSSQRYCFSFPKEHQSELESSLTDFRPSFNHKLIWNDIETPSISQQFAVVNSLPNFHYYSWDGKPVKVVRYQDRLPSASKPKSPRNIIIKAFENADCAGYVISSTLSHITGHPTDLPHVISQTSKRRKVTKSFLENNENSREGSTRQEAHSSHAHLEDSSVDSSDQMESQTFEDGWNENEDTEIAHTPTKEENFLQLEQASPRVTSLFKFYCSELINRGSIFWRVLTDRQQVVCMNAFHEKTGNFLPKEFVHVTFTNFDDGSLHMSCTCQTSTLTTGFSVGKKSTSKVCLHKRLIKSINNSDDKIIDDAIVAEGKTRVEDKVVMLRSKSGIEKYSVVGSDGSVSFVHVTANLGRLMVSCQSGSCNFGQGGKSRKLSSLSSPECGCVHLKEFRRFREIPADEPDDELKDFTEFVIPTEKLEEVFDVESGLWTFHKNSPSKINVSSDSTCETLKKNFKARIIPETGSLYQSNSEKCSCGNYWQKKKRTSTLYSMMSACDIEVIEKYCVCGKREEWDGAEHSIYRSTRSTCAGYELGWQFVNTVLDSGTFSGFISKMTYNYELSSSPRPFMSLQTFIKWFFGWASAMNIDFRMGCKGCGENPKVLACDGTKIGTNFKNVFVTPIEKPSYDHPSHGDSWYYGSMDRCPLKNQLARTAFAELVDQDTTEHLEAIPDELKPFASQRNETDVDHLKKAYSNVYKQLSRTSSVDTIIPFEIVEFCLQASEFALLGLSSLSKVHELISLFTSYNMEIATLIRSSLTVHKSPTRDIFDMIRYCCNKCKEVHAHDVKPEGANPISGTYNPPRDGRAYYFSNHGQQIRKIRSFPIDKRNQASKPSTECSKKFPVVSKTGTSYLFAWFCPLHGHCYGYHVIPFSEGRKDPFSSLYMFCELPPDVVLYDFGCQLDEYCRNRESGFFCCTRFFHDIFHGYNHVCGSTFRCDRLNGFHVMNTSICEQFNSFLQCIKRSAKLMSQTHFNFYLQFFIHVWNMKKQTSFEAKINIADCCEE